MIARTNGMGWNNLWSAISAVGATAFFSYHALAPGESWLAIFVVPLAFLSYVAVIWLLTHTTIEIKDGNISTSNIPPLWPNKNKTFELANCKDVQVVPTFSQFHGFSMTSYKIVLTTLDRSHDLLWVNNKSEAYQVLSAVLNVISANKALQRTAQKRAARRTSTLASMVFRLSSRDTSHWAEGWLGVVIFILFGVAVISMTIAFEDPVLSPEDVSIAVGHVTQIHSSKGNVYFKLVEPQLAFVLHSKSHHGGPVNSALQNAGTDLVRVQYPNSQTNDTSLRYYSVLELHIAGRPILTASQINDAHSRDNLLGAVIGALFVTFGVLRWGWLWLR